VDGINPATTERHEAPERLKADINSGAIIFDLFKWNTPVLFFSIAHFLSVTISQNTF